MVENHWTILLLIADFGILRFCDFGFFFVMLNILWVISE